MKKMYAVMGMALLMSGAIYADVTVVNQTDAEVRIHAAKRVITLQRDGSHTLSVGDDKQINKSAPGFAVDVIFKDRQGKDGKAVVFNSGTQAASNYERLKERDCTINVTGSNGRYRASTCNLKLD